ncbi:signal recognition particle-docking protein FtsY [Pseudomonas sp. NPDC077186]|uniref:signal recognition particle-docking protein FtsY n=1 Tax=Pseudomonas sp. NPDC077186 TaxID=3364421 RepID=UPI0037C66C84
MFGSNDDKKSPAAAGAQTPPVTEEKKSLFGWLRKKPAEPAAPAAEAPSNAPDAVPAPSIESLAIEPQAPAQPAAEPAPLPVAEAQPQAPAEPVPVEIAPSLPTQPAAIDEAAAGAASAPRADDKPGFFSRLLGGDNAPVPPAAEAPVAPEPVAVPVAAPSEPAVAAPLPATQDKPSFFARLKQGLSKTSASLGEGMASLFLGKKAIDDELLDELETRLLTADVGVEATTAIIGNLTKRVARKELADSGALYKALQEELVGLLKPVEQPLAIDVAKQPYVILVVGVNGVGKTTTIGKLAKKLQLEGKKVMLAAGDTFRAAAVEQLQVWGERNNIAVIAQHTGADSASVIFDAVQAAKSRGIDVLIADTAGRLHTKDNLMEELKKVRRVIGKLDDTAPHEVLLVLDAGTGQNAINQAKQFDQTVSLTGLALTKLDGTAKGGVIFALAKQFGLPIRYIGVGEGIDDLRPFQAQAFVQALFEEREQG